MNFLFINVGVPNLITLALVTCFQVADLSCAENVLAIINNDIFFIATNPAAFTACQLSTDDATLAFELPYWSNIILLLASLFPFNFIIIPLQSPWSRWPSRHSPGLINLMICDQF
jgi:hypothetical protein